jgi:hypothetical protein
MTTVVSSATRMCAYHRRTGAKEGVCPRITVAPAPFDFAQGPGATEAGGQGETSPT